MSDLARAMRTEWAAGSGRPVEMNGCPL